jgi:hypothetical protein
MAEGAAATFRRLRTIFVDGIYEGSARMWAWGPRGWGMEVVKRGDGRAPTPGGSCLYTSDGSSSGRSRGWVATGG